MASVFDLRGGGSGAFMFQSKQEMENELLKEKLKVVEFKEKEEKANDEIKELKKEIEEKDKLIAKQKQNIEENWDLSTYVQTLRLERETAIQEAVVSLRQLQSSNQDLESENKKLKRQLESAKREAELCQTQVKSMTESLVNFSSNNNNTGSSSSTFFPNNANNNFSPKNFEELTLRSQHQQEKISSLLHELDCQQRVIYQTVSEAQHYKLLYNIYFSFLHILEMRVFPEIAEQLKKEREKKEEEDKEKKKEGKEENNVRKGDFRLFLNPWAPFGAENQNGLTTEAEKLFEENPTALLKDVEKLVEENTKLKQNGTALIDAQRKIGDLQDEIEKLQRQVRETQGSRNQLQDIVLMEQRNAEEKLKQRRVEQLTGGTGGGGPISSGGSDVPIPFAPVKLFSAFLMSPFRCSYCSHELSADAGLDMLARASDCVNREELLEYMTTFFAEALSEMLPQNLHRLSLGHEIPSLQHVLLHTTPRHFLQTIQKTQFTNEAQCFELVWWYISQSSRMIPLAESVEQLLNEIRFLWLPARFLEQELRSAENLVRSGAPVISLSGGGVFDQFPPTSSASFAKTTQFLPPQHAASASAWPYDLTKMDGYDQQVPTNKMMMDSPLFPDVSGIGIAQSPLAATTGHCYDVSPQRLTTTKRQYPPGHQQQDANNTQRYILTKDWLSSQVESILIPRLQQALRFKAIVLSQNYSGLSPMEATLLEGRFTTPIVGELRRVRLSYQCVHEYGLRNVEHPTQLDLQTLLILQQMGH